MLRVEFHCHTIYSKDSLSTLESLLVTCRRRGIDRVVITDHNTIAGALIAQQMDPERVIAGEEIMTREGELLAAFVKEEIPSGLPSMQAIALLREQGAFISVSHPFDRFRSGHWDIGDLLRIVPLVDAIETFNARCLWPGFNRQAQDFACQHELACTAGSDAHITSEIGRATLLLPAFYNTNSLKQALDQAQYHLSHSAPWVHLASRYATWHKRLKK